MREANPSRVFVTDMMNVVRRYVLEVTVVYQRRN
jgi:hypothetical protein